MNAMISLVLLLLSAVSAQADQTGPSGFCGRMAAQFEMKPAKSESGKPAYEARALKGLGVALFGGSAMVSMMLTPPDDAEISDRSRFASACKLGTKQITCNVAGPAVFELAVNDQRATTEARARETAEVSMVKNRIRCEER
jgi:hypothetical protein